VSSEEASLLAFLHGTREHPAPNDIDRLLEGLDAMLDIGSLDSLARLVHGDAPLDTPYIGECNDLLASVDVGQLSTTMVVAIVRFTASRKSLLSAWEPLRSRAVLELESREPARWRALMHGLLEDGGDSHHE
jgi:hypothetical protein